MVKGTTPKMRLWLRHYLDAANPATFLNATGAAKAAGYKAKSEIAFNQIGFQNVRKFKPQIGEWLDENALSDDALKKKLASLLEAKSTSLQKVKGAVNPDGLAPGVRVIGSTGEIRHKVSEDGIDEVFGDGETLLAVEMDAIEVQRKTLEMAMRAKGMFEKDNLQSRPVIFTPDERIPV